MNMDRKKELKEEYKNYRPEMGLFVIRHIETGKAFLEATNNIKGKINSDVFQLNMETFMRNRDLNKDWKRFGKDAFEVVVLEKLEYDEDDQGGKDYSDELEMLYGEWQRKLRSEGTELYWNDPKNDWSRSWTGYRNLAGRLY